MEINQEHIARMVVLTASRNHEHWQQQFREANGDVSKMKTTTDQLWISNHKTDQVDIARTSFEALPSDWQNDTKISAEIAVEWVIKAKIGNMPMGTLFIEQASSDIRDKWLDRHRNHATDDQKKDYQDLPEDEKAKDRYYVTAAMDAYREVASGLVADATTA